MFNLLVLAGITSAIAGLARLNHSNKLFWTLFVSMMVGFAGGSVLKTYNKVKKENITQQYVIDDYSTIPNVTTVYETTDDAMEVTMVDTIKPTYAYNAVMFNRTLNTSNPEDDTGTFDPVDTS